MTTKKTARSREAIEAIFSAIAKKHKTNYPEIVIAYELGDMSAFAPRNWVTRGIPVKHWDKIAKLSGLSVRDVEAAHSVTEY